MKLDQIKNNIQVSQANIIIISNNDIDLRDFSKFSDNCLIISNLKKLIFNNKSNILNSPLSINQLKNRIENFVQNIKVQFHDLSLYKEKLINLDNDSFCYLTKVELEILTCLIRKKETSKNFIKENILNIKSNIETNSLESHLSRIRKKINTLKSKVKIQTKNEKLLITI